MSTLGECGTAAQSAGAPALLREWSQVFDQVNLTNCLVFCSSHEGLAEQTPTLAGLKFAVNIIRAWAQVNPLAAAGMTALEDPYDTSTDAEKTAHRGQALAAMRYFHALAFKQKDHTAAAALVNSSLGDAEARKEIEARNARANAPVLASAMRGQVYETYNTQVPPTSFADSVLYVQFNKGFERNEPSGVPDLSSPRYGRSLPPNQDGQRLILNDTGVLATAEDEDVEVSRNAMVLLQLNKFALLMLCAGQDKADPSLYPAMGQTGLINKGKASEHQVRFGMDAYLVLTTHWLYLSGTANPTGLMRAFSQILIPRMAVKMQNGHTPGSAAIEIVYHTSCLDPTSVVELGGGAGGGAGGGGGRGGGGGDRPPKSKRGGGGGADEGVSKDKKQIKSLELAVKRLKAGEPTGKNKRAEGSDPSKDPKVIAAVLKAQAEK